MYFGFEGAFVTILETPLKGNFWNLAKNFSRTALRVYLP